MTDGVRIEPADVQQVAQLMGEQNAAINARMGQLLDRLDVLSAAWRGPAADSFGEAREQWRQRAAEHAKALASVPAFLSGAQGSLALGDEAGAAATLQQLNSLDDAVQNTS